MDVSVFHAQFARTRMSLSFSSKRPFTGTAAAVVAERDAVPVRAGALIRTSMC